MLRSNKWLFDRSSRLTNPPMLGQGMNRGFASSYEVVTSVLMHGNDVGFVMEAVNANLMSLSTITCA